MFNFYLMNIFCFQNKIITLLPTKWIIEQSKNILILIFHKFEKTNFDTLAWKAISKNYCKLSQFCIIFQESISEYNKEAPHLLQNISCHSFNSTCQRRTSLSINCSDDFSCKKISVIFGRMSDVYQTYFSTFRIRRTVIAETWRIWEKILRMAIKEDIIFLA